MSEARMFPATPLIGAEFKRRHYHIDVPADWTVAECLAPEALAHHAKKIQRNDIFEFVWADGSREIWARVVSIGPGFVGLRVVLAADRDNDATDQARPLSADDFDLSFSPNPAHAWRIVNKASRDVVAKGFGTKEDAQTALVKMVTTGTVPSLQAA